MPRALYLVPVLFLIGCQEQKSAPEAIAPPEAPSSVTPRIAPKLSPKKPSTGDLSDTTSLKEKTIKQKKRQPGPNIVFILTDDQDRGSLQAMPRTRALFPFWFSNHMLTDPVCCPSRETFMTGQYAHNHGVRSNARQRRWGQEWGGWWAARSRNQNIGLWLQRRQYHTALIGKYLNGFDAKKPPPRGWTNTFLALGDKEKGYFNYRMLDNGKPRTFGSRPQAYSSTVFTDQAIQNIRQSQRAEKPYFLFLSYNAPHNGTASYRRPRLNPEPHPQDRKALQRQIPRIEDSPSFNQLDPGKADYMRTLTEITPEQTADLQLRMRSRWQSLYSLDREIARLVRFAEQSSRPTYFFFTTDNGFFLGQHRLVGKFRPYEEATRFPLLVRTPNQTKRQEEALVGNIDFVPTVLKLSGAKPPRKHIIDGQSLLPFLRGSARRWRREIVLETFPTTPGSLYQPYVAIRGQNDVFIRYQLPGAWPAIWSGEEEYYNLQEDPYQLRNAVADPINSARVDYLRRRTEELRNCVGSACP